MKRENEDIKELLGRCPAQKVSVESVMEAEDGPKVGGWS
jgi:hypothetical protein